MAEWKIRKILVLVLLVVSLASILSGCESFWYSLALKDYDKWRIHYSEAVNSAKENEGKLVPGWYMNRKTFFENPEMFYINGDGIVYRVRDNEYLPCWGLYTITGDILTMNLAEPDDFLRAEYNLKRFTFQIMDSTVIRKILNPGDDSRYNNVYVHTDTLIPVPDKMPDETLDWLQRP